MPSSDPHQVQFRKTTIGTVTFHLSASGKPLQSVVVTHDATPSTLQIGDTYSIYAVINGITTDTVTTADPDAVLAVIEEAEEIYTIEFR